MKRIVTNDSRVLEFISSGTGERIHDRDRVAIGLEQDGRLIAGVSYYDFNGRSITASIYGIGSRWLNREFLWFMFYYPFEQAGVERITTTIEKDNEKSHNLTKRLGFTHEATLQRAGRSGDLHVYRMFREDCKWLKECRYGKKEFIAAAT